MTVASNGDYWKDYPRDIDLARHEGTLGGLRLAARLLKCGRGFLSPHLEREVPAPYLEAMRRAMARLAKGEPLQYVLGEWDFRTLTLTCDRRALIPRPETEELVERVIRFVKALRGEAI